MLLLNFNKKFPNEESCKLYLKEKREQEGITCKCGCKKLYWLENTNAWECSKCKSRRNLRAGTIMEKSKLPLYYWFIAIHLLTSTKKSISALALQRELEHNRYEPIWAMLHKIRIQMGKRDDKYKLEGQVEMDEGFFRVVNLEFRKSGEKLKRGRGSQLHLPVLVMVEATSLTEKEKGKKKDKYAPNKKMNHVKMKVMVDASELSINYEVGKGIDNNAEAHTDSWSAYANLYTLVDTHKMESIPKKEAHKKLPWVHILISNAKRLFLGIHHSIGKDYLQNYLNEYVYKLNRRYLETDMFDRMIIAGVESSWYK